MILPELSIAKYSDLLAAANPTPGGGTTSALSALLGVSFITMIARISAGKKFFDQKQDDLRRIEADAEKLRREIVTLLDDDTLLYNNILAMRRLPKGDMREQEHRAAQLQEAIKAAIEPPVAILKKSLTALVLADSLSRAYFSGTASDLGIAANLLLTAARGAALTIRINCAALHDKSFVDFQIQHCEGLLSEAEKIAERVYHGVTAILM